MQTANKKFYIVLGKEVEIIESSNYYLISIDRDWEYQFLGTKKPHYNDVKEFLIRKGYFGPFTHLKENEMLINRFSITFGNDKIVIHTNDTNKTFTLYGCENTPSIHNLRFALNCYLDFFTEEEQLDDLRELANFINF